MKLFAKKSLGQHFLKSKAVVNNIVQAAKISAEDTVLEIGPGLGILTEDLLKTGAKLITVEKDIRSIEILKQNFGQELDHGKLNLLYGDILEFKPEDQGLREGEYILAANIPYYITGAILEKFLSTSPRPKRMVLLVQKEVADRIIARDGKESLLSISVKIFGEPKIIEKVSRGAFSPPPSVDSAVISIENISINKLSDDQNGDKNGENEAIQKFFSIVRAGFAHKRKFLKKNLESVLEKDKIEQVWQKMALNDKVRAEDLSVLDWTNLVKNS